MRSGIVRVPILAYAQADPQIFLDRQMREDLAALRHVTDSKPGALFGRHLVKSIPSKVMPPESPAAAP